VAGLVGLATGVGSSVSERRSKASLIALHPDDDSPLSGFAFQYFPESISDTKGVNWQSKEIPGGSLPVYQWTASSERTISFTAQFSTDIDMVEVARGQIAARGGTVAGATLLTSSQDIKTTIQNTGQSDRNVDIRSAVAWLRSYMLPSYENRRTVPPAKLKLNLPQSGIGLAGGYSNATSQDADSIICVMTSCEVTWEKFFPSGNPRLASVSLSFAQLPQYLGVVSFPSASQQMKDASTAGAVIGNTAFFGLPPVLNTVAAPPKKTGSG
jgi:hypothetical protein